MTNQITTVTEKVRRKTWVGEGMFVHIAKKDDLYYYW